MKATGLLMMLVIIALLTASQGAVNDPTMEAGSSSTDVVVDDGDETNNIPDNGVEAGSSIECTYVVCPDGSGDFTTIQAAIDAAVNADVLCLCDGTFKGYGNHNIDFLGKAITVRSLSGDPEACVIDCNAPLQGDIRGFYFHSGEGPDSVLEGVTITNGAILLGDPKPGGGAGICCANQSSPTIQNCVIAGNWVWGIGESAPRGGAIYCRGSSCPTITDCTVFGNRARDGGGIYCTEDSWCLMMTGCVITGNLATNDGGGIYGPAGISSCTITGNLAYNDGGGIYGSAGISSCTISGNRALHYGGGIYGACVPMGTIVWGNCADTGVGDEWYADGGCGVIECCNDMGPGLGGFGSCAISCELVPGGGPDIYADPLFCDPKDCNDAATTAGDYHIRCDSPCAPEQQAICGLIGALDVGCTPPGDCDCDGDVDLVDFSEFQVCFTGPGGGPVEPECECVDLDGDGDVDCDDWHAFSQVWTGGFPQPVPEQCSEMADEPVPMP